MKDFFNTISWQKKLFFFASIIAIVPTLFVTNNIISIAKEELKSSTNSELLSTANQLSDELNYFYKSLFETMKILKNGLENDLLDSQEKLSFLLAGIENVNYILSIKVLVDEGKNFVDAVEVRKDSIFIKNSAIPLNDEELFSFDSKLFESAIQDKISLTTPVNYSALDLWHSDAILKIELYPGIETYLVARINMNGFRESIQSHPFNQSGEINIIDKFGNTIFDSKRELIHTSLLNDIISLLNSGARISGINSYEEKDGERYVSCVAFPENLDWAIISVIDENNAYSIVDEMLLILRYWIILGLLAALIGVIIFAKHISKPIDKMSVIARRIAKGDFAIKVDYKAKDSIGLLGTSLETMGSSLKSSFEKIEKQNKELEDYSKTLEIKVEDRTKKLKQSNKDLQEAYKKVLDLNKEKNEFLGIAAHDLKNPLVTVKGYGEMILEDDDLPKELREEFLHAIVDSSERMFSIIKSLLDVNAIEEGKINFEFGIVDFKSILDGVVPVYVERAKEKNIELINHSETDEYWINVDTNFTTQVLENIISNAVKFSPQNKKIFTKIYKMNETIYCSVKDEGPGFTEKDKEKLFGKFAKLSARPTGGEHSSGLGLSIVKKLVELMNGKIYVNSEPGNGAEFIVEFPETQFSESD
ncbi:MAG: HAMP domain-containing protein [Bacteroidetes bacterium]|nr:HAMP domain-containing protein [Bacteroidota bacterium]